MVTVASVSGVSLVTWSPLSLSSSDVFISSPLVTILSSTVTLSTAVSTGLTSWSLEKILLLELVSSSLLLEITLLGLQLRQRLILIQLNYIGKFAIIICTNDAFNPI